MPTLERTNKELRSLLQEVTQCLKCNGTGKVKREKCNECGGDGLDTGIIVLVKKPTADKIRKMFGKKFRA